jgi:hypothetical protein
MSKNTLLLLGIVAVLIAISYIVMQRPGERNISPSESTSVVRIDSAGVDKITIQSPTLSLVMVKLGAEWRIETPVAARANQDAIGAFLGEVNASIVSAMVSDKIEKHSLFQVDSTGIVIRFFRRGVESAGLVIGKPGPSYGDVYVRSVHSNEVFLIDGAISRSAGKSLNDWRDRTIASIPRESIKEIQFQYGDTTFAVSWRDSIWLVGGKPANEAAVNSLLGSLSQLQADNFLDTLPAQASLVATLTFAGVHLRFLQGKNSETFSVQSSSSPQLFELQNWHGRQLLKRKKDLLKVPS